MINTSGITGLYDALTSAISTKLDSLYTAKKIDAETYAKLLSQSFEEALKLSVSAVQQQEQIDKDIEVKVAQILNTTQQTANLLTENGNIVKQGTLLTNQAAQVAQQTTNGASENLQIIAKTDNIIQETTYLVSQELLIDAQAAVATQQRLNLIDEITTATSQRSKIAQETANLSSQKLLVEQQKANLVDDLLTNTQQRLNLVNEVDVRTRQVVVAETQSLKDLLVKQAQITSAAAADLVKAKEAVLLTAKEITEKAQATTTPVAGSVLAKQNEVFTAQASGFSRDAEQKAAKIMADSFAMQSTVGGSVVGSSLAKLDVDSIGLVIDKLITGIAP